ncbi:MAG: isoprenoid biosynthesis glyoxalase ElbB [Bacteroidota bacterium]|nr:isoprenoid biosynthesis glyoxalase ElbB [Bacteroidota bacterium]
MKKFAVILAGCGVYDGAEIQEAVMALYAIKKNEAVYQIFAPNKMQHHVINHITGKEMQEKRNILVESARIARGQIHSLDHFKAEDFDALLLPGGFGVAKNLCTWAFDDYRCTVDPGVEKIIRSMHEAGKPIGAMCISPVILARLFPGAVLTVGKDSDTEASIRKMGGKPVETTHGQVTIDKNLNFFSTPCYMLDASITDIAEGADNIVKAMLKVL